MEKRPVWVELSERSKRIFCVIASLMMVVLCFNVMAGHASAQDSSPVSGSAPPQPQGGTDVNQTTNSSGGQAPPYIQPPQSLNGGIDSYGQGTQVDISSPQALTPVSHLDRENENLTYYSPNGTFVFSEAHPEYLSVRDSAGNVVVQNASFSLTVGNSVLNIINSQILEATDNFLVVDCLLNNVSAVPALAELTVTYDFTGKVQPKITASVTDLAEGFQNWSVVWSITPRTDAVLTVPGLKGWAFPVKNVHTVDATDIATPGSSINVASGSVGYQVNWSDAGSGSLQARDEMNDNGVMQPCLLVTFAKNQKTIDPTVICTTTSSDPLGIGSQRKTFWNDGYYWLFYYDGSNIGYRWSADGVTWSSQVNLPSGTTPSSGCGLDAACRNGQVAVAWRDTNSNVMFEKGTLFGTKITWSSRVTITTSGQQTPVSVAIGYDNSFWVAYSNTSSAYLLVSRSLTGSSGSFVTVLNTTAFDSSATSTMRFNVLLPFENGNMALLETAYGTNGALNQEVRYRYCYESTGGYWTTAATLNITMYNGATPDWKSVTFSSVISANGTIDIVYKSTPSGYLKCVCIYPSGSSVISSLLTSSVDYPTLSLDANGILHVFASIIDSGKDYIEHMQKPQNGGSWVADEHIFASLGSWAQYLTCCPNPVSKCGIAWSKTVTGTTSLLFASTPLPFGTSGANCSAWNQNGLSPYGTYFQDGGLSVTPGSGQVVYSESLVSIPGRAGMNLGISMIYQQPKFTRTDGVLDYRVYPFSNMGNNWSLDLPWMNDTYVYIGNGQSYVITWGNEGNVSEFVNHDGSQFALRDVVKGGYHYYELLTSSGTKYQFNHTSPYQLEQISDLKNYNPANSVSTIPYNCINLTYTGSSPNYVLSSMTESGLGRSISFTYTSGKLSKITRPDGQYVSFSYTGSKLMSWSDPKSRVTTFNYSSTYGLLDGVTYVSGGKVTLTFARYLATTDTYSYFVTRETILNGTTNQIRKTNFNYKLVDGNVIFSTMANLNEASSLQGSTEFTFQSAQNCEFQVSKDASGNQMTATRTWYDENSQPVKVDTYRGNSTVINTTEYMQYDDWGNMVYTRDISGHEQYSSFANTSSQNAFIGADTLTRTTSGSIMYDCFNSWNYSSSGWVAAVTSGWAGLNGIADPPHAPAVQLSRNTSASGSATISRNFAGQSGDFYIQISFMDVSNNRDYILGYGPGGTRIYFMADSGIFEYYDGTNFYTVATCTAGIWYDVGFLAHPSTNKYDVYIDGVLVKTGAPMTGTSASQINQLLFEAGYSGMSSASLLFDNVRVYQSNTVTINGMPSNYIAELYDSHGTLVSRTKTGTLTFPVMDVNSTGTINLWLAGNNSNPTVITDVWPGDVYTMTPRFQSIDLSKTSSGYCDKTATPAVDDSFPTGSVMINIGTQGNWVTDSSYSANGTKYLATTPSQASSFFGGYKNTSYFTMGASTVIEQYVWLEPAKVPKEIMVQLKLSNGSWLRAFWGGDASNHDIIQTTGIGSLAYSKYMGIMPQVTGKWLQLLVKGSDLGISSSTSIYGVVYGTYAGSGRWDLTEYGSAGITITGVSSGMTAKLELNNGTVISATASSSSVTLATYPMIGVYPVEGNLELFDSTGKSLYLSPLLNEIFNGDSYKYRGTDFYPNKIKDSIHDRQVGSFAYQDYANTIKTRSYCSYDAEGNPIEAKSNLGTSWAYSRAGYDIYGNLLWSCDPTGRMTSYQYTSADKNTYPTSSTTGEMIDNFDWDRSWVLSYAPSNRSWITAQYSAAQVYSTGCSINLGFSGATSPDSGNKTMSKDYKTNKISKLSVKMYVSSYSHDSNAGNTMDSGIRMRIYDSSGVNYATYTYWLACWSGNTNNRTSSDPNVNVVFGQPTTNKWLSVVLYPSNNWTIDWSRCDKVKLELFVNTTNAIGDAFNVYYDDLVHGDSADISQHTENFEGTNNWIPYQSPTRAWMLNQNSTTQSHSATHSVQNSFTGAPSDGTDYGTGMMYKVLNVKSVGTVSLWMYVDQYSHDGSTWDTMNTGISLKLYDSGGNNYANYTYWLACWYQGTNNKTASDSYTKVLFGKPTMSTWINVKLNPSSDWNINWSLCSQVKVQLFTSVSGASADSFRAYFDDLTLSSNFSATMYHYDTNNGRLLSVTDVAGHKTSYQYDVLGRLIRTNNTDGSHSNVTYDDTNHKATTWDVLGQKTVYYFDGIGRLSKTVYYGTSTSNYSSVCDYYNWQDKPVRVVQYPKASTTWTTYDYLGRTLSVKNNDTSVQTTSYNDLANTVTFTDELGHKTVSICDNLGRLNATEEYNSATKYNQTLMTYDAVGDLKTVRAANGNVTSMNYDSLGRLTSTAYPDSKSESSTYDLAGRVLNATARNGSVTQSIYDASGKLIRMTGNSDTIRTYYDVDGNAIQKTNALGSISYYYDISNRLMRLIEKIGTTIYWFNFTYDAARNLLTTNYPGSITISNSYDSYVRLSAVKCGSNNLIQYTYNHDNSLATKNFNNGNSTMTYIYNSRDWVSRILAKTSAGVSFVDLNYTYSANGNIAAIKSGLSGVGNEYYTYDYLGRLTKAMANTTFATISYVYDCMGNRLWKNDTTNQQYHYGAYNKLSNDGTYTYVYYPNGEVFYKNTTNTALNRWEYIYNSFDQLVEVKKSTYSGGAWGAFVSTAKYYYDANGGRAKTVEGSSGQFTNITVYNGNNPLYTSTSDGQKSCYIYVGGNLEMRYISSSESYAYVSDALGSVRFVLRNGKKDSLGNVVFSAVTYKPFGGAITATGSDRFTYTSEIQDPSSGLEYLGARYYDQSTGRFVSMDPVLGKLSSPQTIDRYEYCVNNPLRFTDPSGHMISEGLNEGGGDGPYGTVTITEGTANGVVTTTISPTGIVTVTGGPTVTNGNPTNPADSNPINVWYHQREEWLNNGGREQTAAEMIRVLEFLGQVAFVVAVVTSPIWAPPALAIIISFAAGYTLIEFFSENPDILIDFADALPNPSYTPEHINGGTEYPASGRGYFVSDTPVQSGDWLPSYTPEHINGGTEYPASGRGYFVPDS